MRGIAGAVRHRPHSGSREAGVAARGRPPHPTKLFAQDRAGRVLCCSRNASMTMSSRGAERAEIETTSPHTRTAPASATPTTPDAAMPTTLDASAPSALIAVIQALSFSRELGQVTAIVREAARRLTRADGVTFVLREGELCSYVDEDAIAPLWKGRRFPIASCISGWVMLNRQPAEIGRAHV